VNPLVLATITVSFLHPSTSATVSEVRVIAPPPVVQSAAPTPRRVAVATKPAPRRAGPAPVQRPAPAVTPEPKALPLPWNPPLVICPSPVKGGNAEWILLASAHGPICELEQVYGFVAPPGWTWNDPIPLWVPVLP